MTDYTPLHLDWPGCLNVRDLGGLPLTGGGTVRERALVRSESPSFLTDDGVAAATAYGLARIAGKDRTGLVVALALSLVGADSTRWPTTTR